MKKLNNKIPLKRIESNSRLLLSEFGQPMSKNNGCEGSNKSKKYGNSSDDNIKFDSAHNLKVKSSAWASCKRGPPGVVDSQELKRRKMDWSVTEQCFGILEELMNHQNGWVFNQPVDPQKLKIPDYLDLGTIESKLEKNVYFSIDEFVSDVRLTFSNAMLYKPPKNAVHVMAKELRASLVCRNELEWNENESGNEMRKEWNDNVDSHSTVWF